MRRTQSGTGQKSGFGVGLLIAIVAVIFLLLGCLCFFCGSGAIAFAVLNSDSGATARSDSGSRGFEGFASPGEGGRDGAEAGSGSFGVGQDVIVGNVRWTILEAQDLGNTMPGIDEFTDPRTTNGRFIRIRLEVENRGSEALSLTDIDLVDAQGRTFQNETGVYGYVPDQEVCFLEQLNPNLPRTCTFLFQVPPDASDLQASVGDLQLFGSKDALISLNLAAGPQSAPPQGAAEGQLPPQPPAEGQDPAAPAVPAEGVIEEEVPAAEPAVGLGQDIFIGQFRWKLLDVQDLGSVIESSEDDLVPLQAQQGRLIQIRYEVENTGSELATTKGIKIIDAQGRRYEDSVDANWFIVEEEQCLSESLEAGVPRVCTKIYDVPLDATGLKAEVFDLLSVEQGTAFLDLGL